MPNASIMRQPKRTRKPPALAIAKPRASVFERPYDDSWIVGNSEAIPKWGFWEIPVESLRPAHPAVTRAAENKHRTGSLA